MAGNLDRKLRLSGSFTCSKYATRDKRLYFPSEGRRAEDFFALKNPTVSARFEPANLGTKSQHATSRPPKPLCPNMIHIWQSVVPEDKNLNVVVYKIKTRRWVISVNYKRGERRYSLFCAVTSKLTSRWCLWTRVCKNG